MKKTAWQKFKELNNTSLLPRMLPGYYVNNGIIKAAIFLVALILLYAGWSVGWGFNQVYVDCKGPLPCENPYYTGVGSSRTDCPSVLGYEVCSQEFLTPGQKIGTAPSTFYNLSGELVLLVMLGALALNHYLFNSGYFKRMGEKYDVDHDGKSEN